MLTTPRAPWFVVLAIVVAAVAVFEQSALREKRRDDAKAAKTPVPLPPPAPQLEVLLPQKGMAFAQGAAIEHVWSALPGVATYQLDFAVPQTDGGCHFDAPREVTGTRTSVSHDALAPCLVWRVRAADQVSGSSYTVGPPPGCTLPPSAMVTCLESR